MPRNFPLSFGKPKKKQIKKTNNKEQKVIVEVPIPAAVADRRRDYEYYDDEEYYYQYYDYYDDDKDNNDKNAAKRRIHKNDPQEYVSSAIAQNSYPVKSQQQNQPPLTRRVANAVFSTTGLTIAALIGVPLVLAAAYWLFVVNGPTPVVRARQILNEDFMEYLLERVNEALTHNY